MRRFGRWGRDHANIPDYGSNPVVISQSLIDSVKPLPKEYLVDKLYELTDTRMMRGYDIPDEQSRFHKLQELIMEVNWKIDEIKKLMKEYKD